MKKNFLFFRCLFIIFLAGCATTSPKNSNTDTKKDAQTAIGSIANTIGGKTASAKYCPTCGRHFSSGLTACPKDGTSLKEVQD